MSSPRRTVVDALSICAEGQCDIVLLDVMMPGMDGFEVCRRLKADPATAHIPVVMVTALDQPADRVRGLEAGADDFLTKPVDEIALIASVRSLARLKVVLDELRTRASTSASLGIPDPLANAMAEDGTGGRIMLVDDRPSATERMVAALTPTHSVTVEKDPQEALFNGAEGNFDLFIVSLGLKDFDGLRLCSQIRSLERTRHLPILMIADLEDRARVLRGLDLGVNDYLVRPIDRNEMLARVRTQLRRKRYADALRDNVQASIELAVVDPLTGLNNRRYLESHLAALLDHSTGRGRPLSLMILDIDHFKDRQRQLRSRCRRRSSQGFRAAGEERHPAGRPRCAGSAARNSSSSCRIRRWRSPPKSPNGCARRSRAGFSRSRAASARSR